ncbi:MAG TPA: histidine kinase dimerization/phospho-acceptor domain-containing protein, partial [Candidatus Saccharimonadales bacterium]|nr:histidine kinase dimerization/phospho-acceptor domain-containing protein [Candidatus Saccharimonadales bacterium]
MDNLQRLRSQIRFRLLGLIAAGNIIVIGAYWALSAQAGMSELLSLIISVGAAILFSAIIAQAGSGLAVQPVKALWQVILHINPTEHGIAAPKLEELKVGRELIAGLSAQVYQLSDVANEAAAEANKRAGDPAHNFIAQNLPLPLILLDGAETVKFANVAAAEYIGLKAEDMVGKNVYMVLDMSFPSEDTFDTWLKETKTKSATATMSWERIRLNVRDNHPSRLFDLAAYYNRDNPDNNATMLVMFDHTKQYSQDEQAVSFMALSVHELRTPLTLLRGYIEVFEDEIGPTLADPELRDFVLKMRSQADQLTGFVNNILNVARVDDDQLELELQSEDWAATLKSAVEMMSLRAKVRGITLQCRIATDLPPVGVDRLSIREVMS